MSRYAFLYPPFDPPKIVTKNTCKYCGKVTFTKGSDLDTTRCYPGCGRVAYGCILEEGVAIETVPHREIIHGWCREHFCIWSPNDHRG